MATWNNTAKSATATLANKAKSVVAVLTNIVKTPLFFNFLFEDSSMLLLENGNSFLLEETGVAQTTSWTNVTKN